MKMRAYVLALGIGLLSPMGPAVFQQVPQADAAVSIAYSLPELVQLSSQAAVVRATESHSKWEHVAGSKRIVTYTRLELVQRVFGKISNQKSLWVRTLGGAVGRIGQQVAGEAQFRMKQESLVFLTRSTDERWLVTGMAQGHFPVVLPKRTSNDKQQPRSKRKRHLAPSPSLGVILRRKGPSISAQEVLIGKSPEQAIEAIRQAKTQLDAKK